jgi:hypothetical protein
MSSNDSASAMASCHYLSDFLNADTVSQIGEILSKQVVGAETEYLKLANSLIKLLEIEISSGDIVQLERLVCRNDSKLIYSNNQGCILLDSNVDDYGAVPPLSEFSVPQNFPINYWVESVDHNNLVPFDHTQYLDELLLSHQLAPDIHYFENDEPTKHQISKATFTHLESRGLVRFVPVTYTIYFEWINPETQTLENLTTKLKTILHHKNVYLYMTQSILEDYVTSNGDDLKLDEATSMQYYLAIDVNY